MLERNFDRPPIKDTVGIMYKGYTIIRFVADNPGVWLLHCHLDWHQEFGMMIMMRMGTEKDLAPKPKDWPVCGNYDLTDITPPASSQIKLTPILLNQSILLTIIIASSYYLLP